MFELIFLVIFGLSIVHLLVPYLYYLRMSHLAKRPWSISLNQSYEPSVTIIVPTYNESVVVEKKLQNLKELDYPPEKLEIIIVDSASTDNTTSLARLFLSKNEFPCKIKILEEEERKGKANALNFALLSTMNQIVATSDADSYWDTAALKKIVPYLADPQVGAVTGKEEFLNADQNVWTLAESMYRQVYNTLRLGESKIHSTQFFQGELSLYKRKAFEKFNDTKGSDDSGTVKNIIASGYRTIFVPEAVFLDLAPHTLKGRIDLKERRALHLIHALIEAIKLKRKKRFPQPGFIVYTNLFIHLVNPFLSLAFLVALAYLAYRFPFLLLFTVPLFLLKKSRVLIASYLTSNLALIGAVLKYIRGEEQVVWKKIDEMRRF